MEIQPPAKIVPLKPPDAQAVKARLLQNLPHILRALLPAGILRGQKFMVGNVKGDAGDSLIVELGGTKAGLWHDFATGAGGDVLDLWAAIKGFDRQSQFPALLQDVQNQLGAGFQEKIPARPSPAPSTDCPRPGTSRRGRRWRNPGPRPGAGCPSSPAG